MHQKDPSAFLVYYKKRNLIRTYEGTSRKVQVHFLYIDNKDLTRKLEGLHQDVRCIFHIFIMRT